MIQISDLVKRVSESQTLLMAQKSRDLTAAGIDVISMAVGEPDFDTPAHISRAAKEAIDAGFTRYTPVPGYMSLREAICRSLKRDNNTAFEPQQIVVGNGAKQELANAILAVLNPGDEAVIPVPAWVSYMELVKMAGAEPVTVPTGLDTDFKVTPEALEAAITPHTRLFILNSPSNPTGSIYTRDELAGLVEVLNRHPQIVVISDEIYQHINFSGSFTSMASFDEIRPRTVVINGVSKAYAMTGWRVGFMAAPLEIAKAATKLQGQMTSNASSIAQKAAEAAYDGPQECVAEMNEAFRRRRDIIVERARRVKGWRVNVPQGAFYLFPDVTGCLGKTAPDGTAINTSADLAMYLLMQAHVATVDGGAFGTPGYIRLSYALADEQINEAFNRIEAAINALH